MLAVSHAADAYHVGNLSSFLYAQQKVILMAEMRFCPWCAQPLIPKEIDNRKRLACSSPACDYVFWNNPIPVVVAIAEYEGKVLLVWNKSWREAWYGLITGFLEAGEAPEEAVLREVKEEVGLEGEIVRLIGLYPFPEMNQLLLVYHLKVWGDVSLGEELADLKAVHPDKLKPWDYGAGPALRDWLKTHKQ